METRSALYKILMSLPFWWFASSSVYIGMLLSEVIGRVLFALGLFVPIGIWSFLNVLSSGPAQQEYVQFSVFPLILIVVFGGEWWMRKLRLSTGAKIIMILVTLFLLTIVVDYIIWGGWQSMSLFESPGDLGHILR